MAEVCARTVTPATRRHLTNLLEPNNATRDKMNENISTNGLMCLFRTARVMHVQAVRCKHDGHCPC